MVWDLRKGLATIAAAVLPDVSMRRGSDIGRRGLLPRTGVLSATLDEHRVGLGDDISFLREVTALGQTFTTYMWGGRVRTLEESVDIETNELRIRARASGTIADVVAVGSGYSTRVFNDITVSTAINHILDAIGFPAARRDIGASSRLLAWWWLDEGHRPWDAILTLVRTAGPNARIWEDERGVLTFRDAALPGRSGTLYGRHIGTGDRVIVSAIEEDDAGTDRIINDVAIPYAEAPDVPTGVTLTTAWGTYLAGDASAPNARAQIAQGGIGANAGNNVLVLVGLGAYISGGTPDPAPEEEPSLDTIHSESWVSQLAAATALSPKTGSARDGDVAASGGWADYDSGDTEYDTLELSASAAVNIPRPMPDAGAVLGGLSVASVTLGAIKWRGDVLVHTGSGAAPAPVDGSASQADVSAPGTYDDFDAGNTEYDSLDLTAAASVSIPNGAGVLSIRSTVLSDFKWRGDVLQHTAEVPRSGSAQPSGVQADRTLRVGSNSYSVRNQASTPWGRAVVGANNLPSWSITAAAAIAVPVTIPADATNIQATVTAGTYSRLAYASRLADNINNIYQWRVVRSTGSGTTGFTITRTATGYDVTPPAAPANAVWNITLSVTWDLPSTPGGDVWTRGVKIARSTTALATAMRAGLSTVLNGQLASVDIDATVTPRPGGISRDAATVTGGEDRRGQWYFTSPAGYSVPSPAGSFTRFYITGAEADVTVNYRWQGSGSAPGDAWTRNAESSQHTSALATALRAGVTSQLIDQRATVDIDADLTPRPSGLSRDAAASTGGEAHQGEWYIANPTGIAVPGQAGSYVRFYVTGAEFDVTVNYRWAQQTVGIRNWSALYVARGVAPLGGLSSTARFASVSSGDTIRSTANMLALVASRGGEPRVVEVGDQVSANTTLVAALVVESRMNTAPVVTAPPGWTLVAGAPIGSGTTRRVLYAATRVLTQPGQVPDPVWAVSGPQNIVQRKLLVAIAGQTTPVWEYGTSEFTIAAGGTVTIPVKTEGPLRSIVPPVEGEDFVVEAGAITSAALVPDDDIPTGAQAAIKIVAGPSGARISNLALRGIPVINDGLFVTSVSQASIMANNGRRAGLPFGVWDWLSQAEAQNLADAWVAYGASPRRSWTVVLDGDRNGPTLNACITTAVGAVVRTALDHTFDLDGEVVGLEHRVTGAAGNLRSYLRMLQASTAATAPNVPQPPRLVPGNARLTASWEAPGDGGSPITGYDLRYRAVGGSWQELINVTTPRVITGLTNGTEYEVQVRAKNAVGPGEWSRSAVATPVAPPLPVARAPIVNINAVADGVEGSTVVLGFALTAGNALYDNLTYAWSVDGGSLDDATAAAPTWTRPQVDAEEDYDIRLTITAHGTGTQARAGSSDTASDLVLATVTDTPPTLPGVPTGVTSAALGQHEVRLGWAAPADWGNGNVNSRRYQVQLDAQAVHEVAANTLLRTWGSLVADTSYRLRVRAKTEHGTSAWVTRTQRTDAPPLVPPGAPRHFALAAPTPYSVTATWQAPADVGSGVTNYTVRWQVAGGSGWTERTPVTGLTDTISGRQPSTGYVVEVRANGPGGSSAWVRSAIATPAAPPGPPVITVLRFDLIGQGPNYTATAEWTPTGAAATSWEVEWTVGGTSSTQTGINAAVRADSESPIPPSTAVSVRVRGVNAAGNGQWSTPRAGTTPAAPGTGNPVYLGSTANPVYLGSTSNPVHLGSASEE